MLNQASLLNQGFAKLNTNGSFIHGDGSIATIMVLRDVEGNIIFNVCRDLIFYHDTHETEFCATYDPLLFVYAWTQQRYTLVLLTLQCLSPGHSLCNGLFILTDGVRAQFNKVRARFFREWEGNKRNYHMVMVVSSLQTYGQGPSTLVIKWFSKLAKTPPAFRCRFVKPSFPLAWRWLNLTPLLKEDPMCITYSK